VHLNDATEATLVNKGANQRYVACNQGTALECYDRIDLMCQSKRFIPTSHEIKIILRRVDKTKMLFGNTAHCGAAFVHFDDFKIIIPSMKPKLQLSQAINQAMIQNGEEGKYYVTTHRFVPTPVAAQTQRIDLNDLFTGAQPTRVITYMKRQNRYNVAHTLNPNLIAFPDLQFYGLKINEAFAQPQVHNSREAYRNLRTILNRRYDEMPFSHKDYQSSYGIIVTDLTENKDSFNQVLPNSTSGVIGLEMRFNQPLGHQYQLINIAEFRNQLSVGYQNQAHMKYDF
jgi:hypothetical protein